MITEKAKHRIKVLASWEKHGLEAALDAFPAKRSPIQFMMSLPTIKTLQKSNLGWNLYSSFTIFDFWCSIEVVEK